MQSLCFYWLLLGGGFSERACARPLTFTQLASESSDEFPAVRPSQLGGWEKKQPRSRVEGLGSRVYRKTSNSLSKGQNPIWLSRRGRLGLKEPCSFLWGVLGFRV